MKGDPPCTIGMVWSNPAMPIFFAQARVTDHVMDESQSPVVWLSALKLFHDAGVLSNGLGGDGA